MRISDWSSDVRSSDLREKIKTPEVLPILQIEPRSAEGRTALEAILDRDAADADLPEDWSYSLAWFLDLYGSPTEAAKRDEMVRQCEKIGRASCRERVCQYV